MTLTLDAARDANLQLANARRFEVAAVKRDLRSGHLTLTAAMTERPAALNRVLLIDIIRWCRCQKNAGPSIHALGRRALRDGVNLMLPLELASARTRAWVAEHGCRGIRT